MQHLCYPWDPSKHLAAQEKERDSGSEIIADLYITRKKTMYKVPGRVYFTLLYSTSLDMSICHSILVDWTNVEWLNVD